MTPRRRTRVLDHVVASFADLKDPRINRTKRHSLVNVLVMALSAIIANAEGWDDIADFCESRLKWFESFLDLPNGIPSADTFRRVFERLDPKAFERCFTQFVSALAGEVSGEVVAIDGKTLRGLVDKAGRASQLHMVHVWATQQKLLLAQQAVDGPSGEMAAIPPLLELLDVEGAVITTDANSCTAPVTRVLTSTAIPISASPCTPTNAGRSGARASRRRSSVRVGAGCGRRSWNSLPFPRRIAR